MPDLRVRCNTNRQAYEVVERFEVVMSFSKLSEAEVWVLAESKRRESAA